MRISKGKNYLNNLNFHAKNRDFNQKQNNQKSKIIEFGHNFWRENSKSNRKLMYKNHNKSIIFGTKIQIHNFDTFSEN